MDQIRTIIVDDERPARRGLKTLVESHPGFVVVATCADGREAIPRIEELRPDLLLLDIQMPEISGLDIVGCLPPDRMPAVIFVTAYDQYAVRAFDVHAIDYVLKPLSEGRLTQALERAAAQIRGRRLAGYGATLLAAVAEIQRQGPVRPGAPVPAPAPGHLERIMVRTADTIQIVEAADIEWIEATDYYVTLHSHGRALLYRETLKHLEARLDPTRFIRIHLSAIVNLSFVKEIRCLDGDYEVILISGRRLPVSRRRKQALLALGATRHGLTP